MHLFCTWEMKSVLNFPYVMAERGLRSTVCYFHITVVEVVCQMLSKHDWGSATFAKNDYLFRGMYFNIYLQRGPETNTYQWIYILPTFGVRISARISKVETNRSHRWTLALFMRPDAASSSLDGRHNNSTALLSKLCRISKENWLEMVPFFTLPVAKRWFQR